MNKLAKLLFSLVLGFTLFFVTSCGDNGELPEINDSTSQDITPDRPSSDTTIEQGVDAMIKIYEEVVRQGKFTGTFDEWLQSLKGNPGENGKSAYEIYKEANPGYNKTEEEWLSDLLNGALANQTTYKVSFDEQGGSEVVDQEVLSSCKVNKPEDPVKEGYTFDGWYVDDEKWVFNGYPVTKDMTLKAHWKINEYDVNISIYGENIYKGKYKYGDKLDLTDYIDFFDVKNYSIFLNNEKVKKLVFDVKNDLNIDLSLPILEMDTNGGTPIAPIKITPYNKYDLIPTPYRYGYDFVGWKYINDGYPLFLTQNLRFVDVITYDDNNYQFTPKLIAQWAVKNENYEYNIIGDEVEFVADPNNVDVVVPNSIDGKLVTGIRIVGDDYMNIRSIKFSKNIKKIILTCTQENNDQIQLQKIYYDGTIEDWINNIESSVIDGRYDLYVKDSPDSDYRLVTNVTINEGKTDLQNGLFNGCKSLTSVVLPSSLERIGEDCFEDTSLTSIHIPGNVKVVDINAFGLCQELRDIQIDYGVEKINQYAFLGINYNCKKIHLPDSITYIGPDCFDDASLIGHYSINCKEFNRSYYSKDGVLPIFNGVEVLNTVPYGGVLVLPKTVKEINDPTLYLNISVIFYEGTESEFSKIKIPSSDEYIIKVIYNCDLNNMRFDMDKDFNYFRFGNGEYIINNIYDLNRNYDFTRPEFSKLVGILEDEELINGMYIPNNLKVLGYATPKIYFNGTLNDWCNQTIVFNYNPDESPLHLYLNYFGNYKELTDLVVPDGVKEIGTHQFRNIQLNSVTFNEDVEYIGDFAFLNTKIENVKLPENLKHLGFGAFGETNLKSIYLNKNVECGVINPFIGCDELINIVVDRENPYLSSPNGSNVLIENKSKTLLFANNYSNIPNDVLIIAQGALSINKEAFKFPDSVEIVFYNDVNARYIQIPKNAKIFDVSALNTKFFYPGSKEDFLNIDTTINDSNVHFNCLLTDIKYVNKDGFMYKIVSDKFVSDLTIDYNKDIVDLSYYFKDKEIDGLYNNSIKSYNVNKKFIIGDYIKRMQGTVFYFDCEIFLESYNSPDLWQPGWQGKNKVYYPNEWHYDDYHLPVPNKL